MLYPFTIITSCVCVAIAQSRLSAVGGTSVVLGLVAIGKSCGQPVCLDEGYSWFV